MQFTSLLATTLSALAAAQGSDFFGQYKAQFDGFVDKMQSYIPNTGFHDPVAAAEAKLGSLKLNVLTLENWKETLYEPVKAGSTKPQEFWVLLSGGNKTCNGHCGLIERSFNETAGKFALTPGSPYMALLNCDDQPILCNAWSVNPGYLWIVDMLPPPAPINIHKTRLNHTHISSEDIAFFKKPESRPNMELLDSWFHPFDGKAVELGLAIPFGYIVWAFNLFPQWALMLVVSMISRTMMGPRLAKLQQQDANRARAAGAGAGAARPAQ